MSQYPARILLMALLCACVVCAAIATTVIRPEFEELAEEAEFIFLGRVLGQEGRYVDIPEGRIIKTAVRFQVLESYKGDPGSEITLDFLGGQVGDTRMEIVGMPEFNTGEEVILFTDPDTNAASPVLGWFYGVYEVFVEEATPMVRPPMRVPGRQELEDRMRAGGSPATTAPFPDDAQLRGFSAPVVGHGPEPAPELTLEDFKQRLQTVLPAGKPQGDAAGPEAQSP